MGFDQRVLVLAYGHLTGYVFAAQPTQHVFYQDTDGRIHELWWDSGGGITMT